VRSKKLRIASVFVSLTALLVLTGLMAPGATAASTLHVQFVEGHQPSDAIRNELITPVPFDPNPSNGESAGPFVQVLVTQDTAGGGPVPAAGKNVTFRLATSGDGSLATGTLTVATEVTGSDGIATFDSSLSIAEPNEAAFTDYKLVPQASEPNSTTEGLASGPFDIWGAGCQGDGCTVGLREGRDTYQTSEDVTLTASDLTSALNLDCPGQTLIFASHIFSHATFGGAGGPVFLTSRITRQEMKAATNNGQAFVKWCIGLKSSAPWIHNNTSFTTQDTNGSAPGGTLFVAFAPKCPKTAPETFAPCIVKQNSDGNGGNITTGWLTGGDPPRRT
jgi:hypothetical protein